MKHNDLTFRRMNLLVNVLLVAVVLFTLVRMTWAT